MFDYMSNSQIAALILGIVLSVFSIVTTCIAVKYAKHYNSFAKSIALAVTLPFLAFISWFFLIFSFLDGFRDDELLNLIVSIILAIILAGTVIIVAKALYNKHQDELIDEDDAKEDTEQPAKETTEKVEDGNVVTTETLLITHTPDDQKKTIKDSEQKLLTSNKTQAVIENTQKNDSSKKIDNTETAKNGKQEVEKADESNGRSTKNAQSQTTSDELEFEKFLETLRKKAEDNQKNKPDNDEE